MKHEYDIVICKDGKEIFTTESVSNGADLQTVYDLLRKWNTCRETCDLLDCEAQAPSFEASIVDAYCEMCAVNEHFMNGDKPSIHSRYSLDGLFKEVCAFEKFYLYRS